jgi:hypothetical protein
MDGKRVEMAWGGGQSAMSEDRLGVLVSPTVLAANLSSCSNRRPSDGLLIPPPPRATSQHTEIGKFRIVLEGWDVSNEGFLCANRVHRNVHVR